MYSSGTDCSLRFFELTGKDERFRFSPHCWKTRFALAHKQVTAERIPWRFKDRDLIAFTGQSLVPVIEHAGVGIHDSWQIALYLERVYPDAPTLFGGAGGASVTQLINSWVDTTLLPSAARIVMMDTLDMLMPEDQASFRAIREKRFGMTLEEMVADRPKRIAALLGILAPLRKLLDSQPFVGGATPLYADYCAMSMFMWVRCTSGISVVDQKDKVFDWHERMLDLFAGLARSAPKPESVP